VGFSGDQDVVEDFAADAAVTAADHSFAVCVHPGCPWCALDCSDFFGPEDGIERFAVLAVAVA
jgi:hypothetical protein